MAPATRNLVVASTEAFSGKTATIIGLIHQFQHQGIAPRYYKPVGSPVQDQPGDADAEFVQSLYQLPTIPDPLVYLESGAIKRQLQHAQTHYAEAFQQAIAQQDGPLTLIEGPNSLWEGSLFSLSVRELADLSDAPILLVVPYYGRLLVDTLLTAKHYLGDRLLGVVVNKVPEAQWSHAETLVRPFLERQGIAVFALLPEHYLLRSVSVRELVRRLDAEVLCRPDRLDLMVESLTIGAMNVNSALEYFRQRVNMAVVTGGDRTDLQLAALETATQCLILTGHNSPQPIILSRAEDLEIPILAVNSDTLTTVEVVDQSFSHVPLQEPIKAQCSQELLQTHFDMARLLQMLKLPALQA